MMKFRHKEEHTYRFGTIFGYLTTYFIFTTIFFYVLLYTENLPENWTYFHIIGVTLVVTIIGNIIKRVIR